MSRSMDDILTLFKDDERIYTGEEYLVGQIQELALKYDERVIQTLLNDSDMKKNFFVTVGDSYIFKREEFVSFIDSKSYLEDSYTRFKNLVRLTTGNKYLKENKDVVLTWGFKDCVLEGGQDKDDVKRNEVFYNEVLASDDIDRLRDTKVLTNFKKFDSEGEHQNPKLEKNDNLIIKGNNLIALHTLKAKYKGSVNLIYIDPPYNTGEDGFNYNDKFNRSTWLTFMKNRLEVARDLLADDGSIYVNIDFNEAHYLKVLMDEVFGKDCFQREIIWRMGWLSGYKTIAKNYIRNHDTIFYYTKDPKKFTFNKVYNTIEDYAERFNDQSKKDIAKYLKNLNVEDKEIKDFIDFVSKVGLPEEYTLEDTWNCSIYDKLNSIAIVSFSGEKVSKMLGVEEFKGQKAEALLKRIIEVSTNEGDLVLDFFAGTGTTCAVAHKLKRRYIGIEQMDYINHVTVERLKKVISGEKAGISKKVNWEGGGSFLYCELMKWNEVFMEKINKAMTKDELKQIWSEMKAKSFLSYRVKIQQIDKNIKEFDELEIDGQKEFLLTILDKNHLYVNLSEIEDEIYEVTEEDKKLNKDFYYL